MRQTTKWKIINYMRLNEGRWVPSWEIEAQAGDFQAMASQITRRCRELVNDGALEKRLSPKRRVEYRWTSPITIIDPKPVEQEQLFEIKRRSMGGYSNF